VEQQIRGNGIGLSLVQQLLQALGGRVSVQSAPGQGATFTLHLPVASEAALTAMTAGAGPTAEPA
jgi:two-component system sensor histidine kinase PilS (NtrC family)